MRPDEHDAMRWLHDDERDATTLLDTDLRDLELELAAAGGRARRAAPSAATGRFTRSLRDQLLGSYGDGHGLAAGADGAAVGTWARASASSRAHGVSAPMAAAGAAAAGSVLPGDGPVAYAPAVLRPRVTARPKVQLAMPRWSYAAIAAALVLAVGAIAGDLLHPIPATTRVADAVGATLVRDGVAEALAPGSELREGDEIRVAADGSATLAIASGRVRLAGGSDLRLDGLDREHVVLDQLAGRAWHRVALPSGGTYAVTTGDVTWTARGTAFDIDREVTASGDVVHGLAVEHAVTADGPGLTVTLAEGHGATVRLGASPTIDTSVVAPSAAIGDPWIRAAATADLAGGFGIGFLAGWLPARTGTPEPPIADPTPSSEPTPTGTEATPVPTPEATPVPTIKPTPKPTPKPTAKPTPTPAPTLGTMSLAAFACPGGVLLDWSVPELSNLNHVQVLRGTSAEIPVTYPPSGGAVAIDGGYSANPAKSDGYDASDVGSAWYRAVAYDAADKAIAASPVQAVTTKAVKDLGALAVVAKGPGSVEASWTTFGGSADCFSYYKLVASADDPEPSYTKGSPYVAAIGDQAVGSTIVDGLAPSGGTLWMRLQVVRSTSLGVFIVAQTSVTQVTVP